MIKPLDPSLAQGAASKQTLDDIKRKAEMETQNLNGAPDKNKEKKLREASEGFESIFIQQMWKSMRASLPQDGLMHSKEEKFWQGMYDQELSKSMASAGGIGLADMMMKQLSKNLQNASEVTAETTQSIRTPLDIEPVPLIQQKTQEELPYEPIKELIPEKTQLQQNKENQQVQNVTQPTAITIPSPVEQALQEFTEQQRGTSNPQPSEQITQDKENSHAITSPNNQINNE